MPRSKRNPTNVCPQTFTIGVRKEKLEDFNLLLAAFLKKVNIMNKNANKIATEANTAVSARLEESARIVDKKTLIKSRSIAIRELKITQQEQRYLQQQSDNEEWRVVCRRRRQAYDAKTDMIISQMKKSQSTVDLGRKIPDKPKKPWYDLPKMRPTSISASTASLTPSDSVSQHSGPSISHKPMQSTSGGASQATYVTAQTAVRSSTSSRRTRTKNLPAGHKYPEELEQLRLRNQLLRRQVEAPLRRDQQPALDDVTRDTLAKFGYYFPRPRQ